MKSKFAQTIRKARKELGYTQAQVAEAVSISVRWYQMIETGRKIPGTIIAFRIVLFLKIDIEVFREEVALIVPIPSVRRTPTF